MARAPPPRPGPAPVPAPARARSPKGRHGRSVDRGWNADPELDPDPAPQRRTRSGGDKDRKPAPAPVPAPAPTRDRSPRKKREDSSRRPKSPAPAPAPAQVRPPAPGQDVQQQDGAWNTKLFHCFHDIPSCVWTLFLPCIAFGQIAEILDEGQPRCTCHAIMYIVRVATAYTPCFMSFRYRTKLRLKFRLPEEPCNDFCVHLFCELCALAQEYRELTLRGIDPAEGWEGYRRSMEAPRAVEMER